VTIGGRARAADVVDAAIEGGRPAGSFRGEGPAVVAAMRREGVAAVLAGPGPHEDQVVLWWTSVLGRPRTVGGVDVWRV
jgi:hypothetical protein